MISPFSNTFIESFSEFFAIKYASINFSSSSTAVSTKSFLYSFALSFKSLVYLHIQIFYLNLRFAKQHPSFSPSRLLLSTLLQNNDLCKTNGLHPNLSFIISTSVRLLSSIKFIQANSWHFIFISLPPDSFRLRFSSSYSIKTLQHHLEP